MNAPTGQRRAYGGAGQWWLAWSFLAIGVYCVAWPTALADEYWDHLPSRTAFGYALGAIFGGGGLLYLFDAIERYQRFAKVAQFGKTVGGVLTAGGFAYVFWTLFRT